ncbi:MAG: hypothetical protein ACTSP6_02600 [Promethearchaeota archaeon]
MEEKDKTEIMDEKEILNENEKSDNINLEKEKSEKERIEKEHIEKERIEKERLEKERLEREKRERFERQNRLIPNNMVFIIPSWGDLLGYPTLGKYVGHDVAKVITDIVIFFGGAECAVETEKGTVYFIFGLGYYYTKFELHHDVELSRGKYITDNRLLTGLIMSDFVYDKLASSEDLTLEDDKDVIIAEKVVKIPIDLSFKSESRQTLIKGAILRNIFIPNKDIFLDFMDKIRKTETYNLDSKGHLLLSSSRDFYNKIIVSDKMKFHVSSGYMEKTAGLDEIIYGVDEYIPKILSPIELQNIEESINNLKKTFSAFDYDPIYPYSILENVSKILKSETTPISLLESSSTSTLSPKNSVLFSAENRLSSVVEWPNEFARNIKEEIEIKPAKREPIVTPYSKPIDRPSQQVDPSTIKDYREPQIEGEQFKLRVEKSEKVEVKPLPPVPTEDIEQILLYVRGIIEENFDMPSIGRALGLARDSIKSLHPVEYSKIKWELSKWSNIYEKKEPLFGLPPKEKKELLEGVDKWITKFEEERFEKERREREEKERLERTRLEKERKEREEKERLERERIEKERIERERVEKERIKKERSEREMLEKEKIEKEKQKLAEERRERERLTKLREEQERIKLQREQEKAEAERQEQLRVEKIRLEKEKQEREALEREKIELNELKAKKKQQAKLLKQKKKQEKKLEKQKAKLAKNKAKEEEKLSSLRKEYESMEK